MDNQALASHECERCHKTFPASEIKFAPDPYQWDVNDNDTPVWECGECREESAGEI